MRIARFTTDSDSYSYGVITEDNGLERIAAISGDPIYSGINPTGQVYDLEEVRLLAPVIPRSKVIGVGLNFAAHIAEMKLETPTEPVLFLKPNTAVVGPGDPVVTPEWTRRMEYEGELCVVIGRICKDLEVEDVPAAIFGYTIGNDMTARDIQGSDVQWTRSKSFDTSAPLGPWIETEYDPAGQQLQTYVDGELRQDSNLDDMIFSVPELISYISKAFTLLPGDVIMTGTPSGVGKVTPGQQVSVHISGLGVLENTIR